MIYQPLSTEDAIAEIEYRILIRDEDWHYHCYTQLRDFTRRAEPVMIKYWERKREDAHQEVRRSEMALHNRGQICEHRYEANEQGDFRCVKCHKFSLLVTVNAGGQLR